MNSYLITAKIPKNIESYFRNFKKEAMERCIQRKWECIIEYLSGRIIIFSDHNPCEWVHQIKNVVSCGRVEIFNVNEYDALVKKIVNMLREENCQNFAIRSNKKNVEIKIGEDVISNLDIAVNLENADCKITVEKRDDYYLLFV